MAKSSSRARSEERSKPAIVPVRVEVPEKIYQRAARLAAGFTHLSLGQVLERWIEDAAYGLSRPESWEYRQATQWLRGHPFPEETKPRPKHRARRAPEIL